MMEQLSTSSETPQESAPVAQEAAGGTPAPACYLFFVHGFGPYIHDRCVRHVLDSLAGVGVTPQAKSPHISLVLQSNGGSADAAFLLVNAVRACCDGLDVLVPYWAKSATTLMAMAADTIYMGIRSELGPLDMQLQHPQQERFSSALDGAQCLDDLQTAAAMMAARFMRVFFDDFREITDLRKAELCQEMLRFSSLVVGPVMQQVDPWVLHECVRHLDTTRKYATALLRKYMFREKADGPRLANDAAGKLVEDYPAHGFAILKDEAKEQLSLEIGDGESRDDWAEACKVCEGLADMGRCLHVAVAGSLKADDVLGKAVRCGDAL